MAERASREQVESLKAAPKQASPLSRQEMQASVARLRMLADAIYHEIASRADEAELSALCRRSDESVIRLSRELKELRQKRRAMEEADAFWRRHVLECPTKRVSCQLLYNTYTHALADPSTRAAEGDSEAGKPTRQQSPPPLWSMRRFTKYVSSKGFVNQSVGGTRYIVGIYLTSDSASLTCQSE